MLLEELLWHFHRNDGHLKKMMRSLLGVVCICAVFVSQPLNDDDWFESDGPDGVVELVLVDPGTDVPDAGGFPQPGVTDSQGREWVERDGPDGVVELILVDPGTDVPSDGSPIE